MFIGKNLKSSIKWETNIRQFYFHSIFLSRIIARELFQRQEDGLTRVTPEKEVAEGWDIELQDWHEGSVSEAETKVFLHNRYGFGLNPSKSPDLTPFR